MPSDNPIQNECQKLGFSWHPDDIETTLGWIKIAKKELDMDAMDALFWKLRMQVEALEEEYLNINSN